MGITEFILKSRRGVYKDTPENRRKHRVGMQYGSKKEEQEPLAAGKAIIVPDVHNSKKINIDKYLSPKLKKKVDGQVDAIVNSVRSTSKDTKEFMEQMGKLYKDEVTALNEAFETLSKAKRAEMLYFAMKISNIAYGTNYMLSEQKKGVDNLQGAREDISRHLRSYQNMLDKPEDYDVATANKWLDDVMAKTIKKYNLNKYDFRYIMSDFPGYDISYDEVMSSVYVPDAKKNDKDILDALVAKGFEKSKKGKPMSFESADGKSPNPNFGKQGKTFTHNCQTCVVVYELRRRGFDVEAKGVGYNGDLYGIQLRIAQNAARTYVGKEDSWYRAHDLPHFPRASKKAYTALAAEFMDRTREPGRYTFSYKNRGYRSAHILCFERLEDGDGFFYDPQVGAKYTPAVHFFESRVDVKYPFNTVVRVDNLDIKPEVAVGVCNLIKE